MHVRSRQMGTQRGTHTPQKPNSGANAIALTLWIVLWVLNGVSTALPFVLFGERVGAVGIWLGVGICVHLVV